MRNKVALQALCLIFPVFIKSMVSFPLYSNGLYQHWDAETNSFLYCREVLVKQGLNAHDGLYMVASINGGGRTQEKNTDPQEITGYEAIPCTENEAEDSVRKCPVGQYQPDQTNSSSSPHCIVEPECTEEEIKKDLKCVDGYCWTVCICSLEVGKCGLDPLNCLDIKNIQCMGKVLQDCSCALPVVPTKLPTSPPTRSILSTTFKPINPDWTAKTLSPIPTDTTKNNDKTDVTKDGTDTGSKGNEVLYLIPVIIIIVLVIVVLCIKCVHKRCSNRPKEVDKESNKMLESDQADKNIGDKVSEATDSGVSGLSKGSHENLELGETTSNNINVSNGSEMESGRNVNNSVGDDHDAARGQSSSQVEVHNYSKPRVEPTFNLAEKEDSCLESDPFLSPNGCADNPGIRDSSQQSDENCEPGKTDTNNILTNGLDDPDMTSCKWTSCSGTNRHHTDADHGTDPDSNPSLCQLDVQKDSRQREKPIIVDMEMVDSSVEITSLQAKKVAVVSPFNEVQTVPVEDSPARMNAENQPLRGEGYSSHSEGVTAVNLSMDWITLGSSIYHDNTNQQDD